MRRDRYRGESETLTSGASFARFYAQNHQGLLRFFVRRVYDPQLALDLTAETFAQAFLARRRFRGSAEADAAAWLYKIGRRQLARYYRRGTAELKAIERLGIEPPKPSTDELERVEELADLDRARAALREGLDRLTDQQRLALRLRVVDELSYPEVATQLGVSEPTARARVSRALRALAEAVDIDSLAQEVAT